VQQGYNRPAMEAYNRMPAPVSRSQAYSAPENRLAYGPSYYNGGGAYNGRGAYNGGGERSYAAPVQSYRAPTMQAYRGSGESFGSQAYKEPKSGGSHFFGGGESYKEPKFKEPKYSEPKFKAPKEPKFKEPKMSGGGHSSGGHSSGGHSSVHRW
jgi:hypothetical protein